ncbi:hypothetical protein D9M72_266430 [compost metagenome]
MPGRRREGARIDLDVLADHLRPLLHLRRGICQGLVVDGGRDLEVLELLELLLPLTGLGARLVPGFLLLVDDLLVGLLLDRLQALDDAGEAVGVPALLTDLDQHVQGGLGVLLRALEVALLQCRPGGGLQRLGIAEAGRPERADTQFLQRILVAFRGLELLVASLRQFTVGLGLSSDLVRQGLLEVLGQALLDVVEVGGIGAHLRQALLSGCPGICPSFLLGLSLGIERAFRFISQPTPEITNSPPRDGPEGQRTIGSRTFRKLRQRTTEIPFGKTIQRSG